MSDVNAPPVPDEWAESLGWGDCSERPPLPPASWWWCENAAGDGLRLSSSSVELAPSGEPVTEMLSVSKLSSLRLLSFSSVCGGVSCEEFVSEMFAGERVGLVVLCGLLALLAVFGLWPGVSGDVVPICRTD